MPVVSPATRSKKGYAIAVQAICSGWFQAAPHSSHMHAIRSFKFLHEMAYNDLDRRINYDTFQQSTIPM